VSTVVILGAGVMGSSMCMPLCDRGHAVSLVGTPLDDEIIGSITATGRHPRLNTAMPKGVTAFHHGDFGKTVTAETNLIVLGVASAGVGWAIDRLCETLSRPIPVVMITKGMYPEPASLTALPDHVAREVKRRKGFDLPVAAIGGPCIAGELAVKRNTGTVITSHDPALSARLCRMLETDYYHPRPSPDVIGVEVCAAFKNFFAIAVGWAAGHREKLPPTDNNAFNHNAAAILFDQAITELMEITLALGGTAKSVWGMPGAGDLYVTCQAGRNSRLGNNLGRGLTYRQTKEGPMKGDTIEGAELGLAVSPSLRAMLKAGTLDPVKVPLTRALLDALVNDAPLVIPWADLHPQG